VIVERPLTIAEIFDRTVTIVVRRWKVLTVIAIIGAAPDTVIAALQQGHQPGSAAVWGQFSLDIVEAAFFGGAVVLAAGADEAPRSALAVLRELLPRFWSLVAASMVIWLCLAASFVVAAIPVFIAVRGAGNLGGVVVAVALLPWAVFPALVLGLAFPIVVLENVGGLAAVKRAFARVRRDGRQRASLLGLAFLVFVFGIPVAVTVGLETLAELPGLWFINVCTALVNDILLGTLTTALLTVAALDYRVRSEGTDLASAVDTAAACPIDRRPAV
jgi:hypothetical protein